MIVRASNKAYRKDNRRSGYSRLAGISVAQRYNLRQQTDYQRQRRAWTKTRPVANGVRLDLSIILDRSPFWHRCRPSARQGRNLGLKVRVAQGPGLVGRLPDRFDISLGQLCPKQLP